MASVPEVGIEAAPARRAFVVVGMHRSGTSAMTRTLSLLGAALPKGLMPPVEENNESGFWEPQSVADLNDEILQALDSDWDDVFTFRPRRYLSNFDHFYLGRAVDLLEAEFNGSEVIVLKDPRISVLTSFWDRALREAGYSTHYIVMVRNPLEVAESLRMRDGFPREKSLLLWSSYMIAADRDTRDRERIFIGYDQLMNDWRSVRQRIETNNGFPFPRDTAAAANEIDRHLDHRLRHHEVEAEDLFSRSDVPEEVKALYRVFKGACEGAEIDRALVDSIEAELAKMDRLVGPLLADLRGRVRSLSADIAQLNDSHAEATAGAEALSKEIEAERDRSAAEMEAKAREAAEMAARLAAVEAERDSERERLEQARSEMAARLAALEAERDSGRERLEQARSENAAAEARLNERLLALTQANQALISKEAEIEKSRAEHKETEARLNERLAAVTKTCDRLARKEFELDAALHDSRAEKERVEARLDDRYVEIATLTALLAERETLERHASEDADWLRQIASILLGDSATRKGRLFRLLPAAFNWRRQQRLLKRKGLFDAEAYLDANADVATDRTDPLRHYLQHGIKERRRRG
jgi:hypothetical protein